VYAKCCGTLVGIIPEAHPWALDLQPHGLVGWSREKIAAPDGNAKMIFGTYTDGYTGVPVPKGIKPVYGPGRINPCSCRVCCGIICCGGILGDCCPKMCCQDPKEELLAPAPPGVTEHAGKPIEYVDDPKYLFKKPEVKVISRS